jgi:hypothetical protein
MHGLVRQGDGEEEDDDFADVPHVYNADTLHKMISSTFAFMEHPSTTSASSSSAPQPTISASSRSTVIRSSGIYSRSPPKIQGNNPDEDDDDESSWPQSHAPPTVTLNRPPLVNEGGMGSDEEAAKESKSTVGRGDVVVDVTSGGVKVHVSPVTMHSEAKAQHVRKNSSSDSDIEGPLIVPRAVISKEQLQRQQQLKKAVPIYISSSDDDDVYELHPQQLQGQVVCNAAVHCPHPVAAASVAVVAAAAAVVPTPDEAMKRAIAEEHSKGDAVDRYWF